MEKFYTNERNVQIVIALMKAHGIKKVIVSPGTTNLTFVASIQQDNYFELYSAADERSAAYIACGLAAESGEAVALSCTGATASRNYMPGLTEAFYRKLPVLAITSSQNFGRIGSYTPQVIDRSIVPNDIARVSVSLQSVVAGSENEKLVEVQANRAMLELFRAGGGPVHIDLETTYSRDFSVKELPPIHVIKRITRDNSFPEFDKEKIAIIVGAHTVWDERLTNAVDAFCASYNAVVFCDHTSNYYGKYKVLASLASAQEKYKSDNLYVDILIYIGEVSGAYYRCRGEQVWRVSPDGEIRDTFGVQSYVFEMSEIDFFEHYAKKEILGDKFFQRCKEEYQRILRKLPELPFSNAWIAKHSMEKIPTHSVLHLGILNTLRSWNFFESANSIPCYANTGGFGIDGGMSSLIGASLAGVDKLYFGVFGDLLFFYDMNSLGNRHIQPNVRILLINNGCGTEFKNYNHYAAQFGRDADDYIAAAGHYGNKSPCLVKHYAEDLGFEYFAASNKEEYLKAAERFFTSESQKKPMLFEVFTNSAEESEALKIIRNVEGAENSFR